MKKGIGNISKTKIILIIFASLFGGLALFCLAVIVAIMAVPNMDSNEYPVVEVDDNWNYTERRVCTKIKEEDIRLKSGIFIPSNALFTTNCAKEDKIFWKYISEESFKLPENANTFIADDVKIEHSPSNSENSKNDFYIYEKEFSLSFKHHIEGTIDYQEGTWTNDDIVFNAQILKTPKKYYLLLSSQEMRSDELEAKKEAPTQ